MLSISHTHLILLQFWAEVCVDIFKQFNGFVNNVVRGNKHRLPEVLQSYKIHLFSDKSSSPRYESTLVDVHHTEEPIKTPEEIKTERSVVVAYSTTLTTSSRNRGKPTCTCNDLWTSNMNMYMFTMNLNIVLYKCNSTTGIGTGKHTEVTPGTQGLPAAHSMWADSNIKSCPDNNCYYWVVNSDPYQSFIQDFGCGKETTVNAAFEMSIPERVIREGGGEEIEYPIIQKL